MLGWITKVQKKNKWHPGENKNNNNENERYLVKLIGQKLIVGGPYNESNSNSYKGDNSC